MMARLTRLRRGEKGASAVEFALIAPLFFAIMFGALDLGATMFRQVRLSAALDGVMRDVRIAGTAGGVTNPTTQDVANAVCDRVAMIPDCRNTIVVETTVIRDASDFPTGASPCIDRANGNLRPAVASVPGQANETVLVRVCAVANQLFTPTGGFMNGIGISLEDANGDQILVATTAYVKES